MVYDMNTYLISEDYLMHHGVKGMKWGVRHDKPSSGNGRYAGTNSRTSRNKKLKLSGRTKALIALTGVAAAAVVAPQIIRYGKIHVDDILRAGTKIHTVHHHPELVTEGKKFYTTNKAIDKIKYKASFGENHLGIKKQVTGTVQKNIKIAGGDTGKKTMVELAKKDKDFANYLRNYTFKDPTKLSKQEASRVYFSFNRNSLLGEADTETTKFINALKDKGYGGVADLNDRRGWNTSANILFDNKNIGDFKVRQMDRAEINNAKAKAVAIQAGKETVNAYSPYVAVGAAFAASAGVAEDKAINDRINKSNQKKRKTNAIG